MESINDLAGQLLGGAPPHACLEKFVAESSCQFTPTCWAKSWAQILELSHQLVDFSLRRGAHSRISAFGGSVVEIS
jgi:hypothetical protein